MPALLRCLLLLFTARAPGLALGHEANSLQFGSFLAGLTHPVLGVDHFLAMVSVGIVSAQIGGRAIWTVPATFVAVMAIGGGLGVLDAGLSAIEVGIAFSVLVLGVAIAADRRVVLLADVEDVGHAPFVPGRRNARTGRPQAPRDAPTGAAREAAPRWHHGGS